MSWRRFPLSLVWIVFGCAANAQAGWTISESQTEPSILPSIVHQHVVLSDSSTGSQATLDLAKFSAKSCRLHLIDNPAGTDLATAMNRAGYVAGANGGYSYIAVFHHNNRLYELEGKAFVAGGQAELDAMRFQQSLDFP